MQQLKDCFVRIKDGEWFCRAPCILEGQAGAISVTPGVSYRRGRLVDGLEVAAILYDWHLTGRLPPSIVVR